MYVSQEELTYTSGRLMTKIEFFLRLIVTWATPFTGFKPTQPESTQKYMYNVSQKIPMRFSDIFPKTVANF